MFDQVVIKCIIIDKFMLLQRRGRLDSLTLKVRYFIKYSKTLLVVPSKYSGSCLGLLEFWE